MRASLASEPGRADGRNEDWAGATVDVAVVLDGLSEGPATGCVHGTPWYVQQLGSHLIALAADFERTLTSVLAQAITDVAAMHSDTCDLSHPGSPCSTVAMIRSGGTGIDYLVLADSAIVVQCKGGPKVIQDRRVNAIAQDKANAAASPTGSPGSAAWVDLIETQQALRNRPGGYWVAQVDPEAAEHALTGTVDNVRGAALLSDGAALLVTDFHALDWAGLLAVGYELGPAALIARTRELEDRDPDRTVWPRYKHRDDATAIICVMEPSDTATRP